jgi:hypothetical protein
VAGDVEPTQSASVTIVQSRGTAVTLSGTPNPAVYGQTVTFTATVRPQAGPGVPTGVVTFKDAGTVLAPVALNAGGAAIYRTSSLAPGSHSITATYSGGGNYAPSASVAVALAVNKAGTTTTLTSSPNPAVLGATVTVTAAVAAVAPGGGIPTGSVTFQDGSTVLGTIALSGGAAVYRTGSLALGTHGIRALYTGSAGYLSSTATLTQQVSHASTTTLTGAPNPTTYGQTAVFTATVSGAFGVPIGTVTFKDGSAMLGTVSLSASGSATFSTTSLTGGSHSITAAYGGGGSYAPSTSGALAHAVNRAGTSTVLTGLPNPALFGASVTFTATVSGPGATPTGSITFEDGGTPLATVPLDGSGTAGFSTSSLGPALHSISALYSGSGSYSASSMSILENVEVFTGT